MGSYVGHVIQVLCHIAVVFPRRRGCGNQSFVTQRRHRGSGRVSLPLPPALPQPHDAHDRAAHHPRAQGTQRNDLDRCDYVIKGGSISVCVQ